jgi:hypothetical protein
MMMGEFDGDGLPTGPWPAPSCADGLGNRTESTTLRAISAVKSAGLVPPHYDPATEQFLSVDQAVNQTGQPYQFAAQDPVNTADPSGDLPCTAGGACGTLQYLESVQGSSGSEITCQGLPTSSGPDYGRYILGLGAAGATSQSIGRFFNSAGDAAHFDEGAYLWNAERSIQFSNAARGLSIVGAGVIAYNDVTSGKSVGYTAGDVVGSAAGGSAGGFIGSALCGGLETGIGVLCGIAGGAIGGKIGGI